MAGDRQGQSRRGWRETCLCWLVWSTRCFSASVPGVTLGQLLKSPVQSGPAELEDEDGAANLSLFRACPEGLRIKSGGFAHFIHSVCSLPRGVRRGSS